jgi:hypothetical protein
MNEKGTEIEVKVEAALECCFATKARNTVKPKPVAVVAAPPVVVRAPAPKAVAAVAAPAPKVASKPTARRTKAS